jgi:hypothetical protein
VSRAVSPLVLFGVEPPKPRIEAIPWAEFADLFRNTRQAFLDHERSKAELKVLMPEDAKEAIGHGVRAKRSKSSRPLGIVNHVLCAGLFCKNLKGSPSHHYHRVDDQPRNFAFLELLA